MAGTLEGVRVVELTAFAFGPMAGMMLSDLGADVIKIEDPKGGDPSRYHRYMIGSVDCGLPNGRNALFECMNRNKRSITINLKEEKGREIARALAAKADVFIQNFRPGVAEELGLGYEDFMRWNPRVVYASASAYGPEGPDAKRPGLDYIGQARSGIMWTTGHPGDPPYYSTAGVADMIGAIMLAYGVVAALVERERHGLGQKVDVSHLAATMWLQLWAIGVAEWTKVEEWPRFDRNNAGNPLWNHYQCADGEWIALALLQADRYWHDFCQALDITEIEKDPRFTDVDRRRSNNRALIQILEQRFRQHPRSHWEKVFSKYPDFIWDKVQRIKDLKTDCQVVANKYMTPYVDRDVGEVMVQSCPVLFSGHQWSMGRVAPGLGEHTFAILSDELSYSDQYIAELVALGVV